MLTAGTPRLCARCRLYLLHQGTHALYSIRKDNWKWQLLLAGILIAIAAGMVVATKRVDYTWHWERVPGYFFYYSEELEKAPFDGQVTAIAPQGETSTITVKAEDGELFTTTVETAGIKVKSGEELFEGDTPLMGGPNFGPKGLGEGACFRTLPCVPPHPAALSPDSFMPACRSSPGDSPLS